MGRVGEPSYMNELPGRQRLDDVGVAGDPADVGRTPIDSRRGLNTHSIVFLA